MGAMSNANGPNHGRRDPESIIADAVWILPELGPALARVSIAWDPASPTADVSSLGHIRMNPGLPESWEVPVVMHELLHLVGQHFMMQFPDMERAQKATDRWINAILKDIVKATGANVEIPAEWLYPKPEQWDWSVAQLYEAETASPKPQGGQGGRGKGSGPPQVGQGCAPQGGQPDASDDKDGEDGDGPIDEMTARGVTAGIGSVVSRFGQLIVTPPPRVLRRDIMKEACTAAWGKGKPRRSWAKLGRRSTPEIPRPGKQYLGPKVVVVVDVSGSMYPELNEILAEAQDLASIAEVHLILHDDRVLYSGKAKKQDLPKIMRNGGGTDFVEALGLAGRLAKSCPGGCAVVHFTDGYGGAWPAPQVSASFVGLTHDSGATAPPGWRVRRLKGPKAAK